ncbi:ribonuclease III [Moraxella caviae]|uniref:Ribonuclease 3 n=1 Tax=Moraxella caviae TaxID=34060 RepID=A0A1S9ZZK8_9GAMM|nr:ribonuclease III [Moraxella caviae]OOR88361.1 ribonuclease III [Moraxella caviae]STZ10612.1 Ribonuclease 3 [Moraxella caviae]
MDNSTKNTKPKAQNSLTAQTHFASFEQGLPVLCEKLGYTFKNIELPRRALTHRSYDPKASYERLEFLGDALLGVIIAEALFEHFPQHDEGKLTRMRATLVRQETLVQIAEKLELSRHLILGVGERKGGGRHRASILADAVEAIIAAVYLDSEDVSLIAKLVQGWYEQLIAEVGEEKVLKDAKSRLQEWLQGNRLALPTYELKEIIGNAPNQTFVVTCHVPVERVSPITETGESRRIAEQKCAELMINQLNKLKSDCNRGG